MVKKTIANPNKVIRDANKDIDEFLAKVRSQRKWYRKLIDFFREVLTKRVAFAILRMSNKQKPKKEKIMNIEKTKKQNKKPATIKVSTLVPYTIIFAVIIAVAGVWVGISYEKNRVAEIEQAVQLSKTSQQ